MDLGEIEEIIDVEPIDVPAPDRETVPEPESVPA